MKTTALLAGGIVLGLMGCGRNAAERKPAIHREIGTTFVVRDSLMETVLEATGVAEPILRADLSTRMMSKVTMVSVHEGDKVRAGQVLVRVDGQELADRSRGVASGLDAARSQLRLARAQADRMRSLYADSAATKASLDQAESELQRAEAGLSQVEAQASELRSAADYAVIAAPFSGKVVSRKVDPGALAVPGQTLVSIEDASRLRLSVNTSTETASRLGRGMHLVGKVGGRAVDAVVEGVVPTSAGNLVVVNAVVENRMDSLSSAATATLELPRGKSLVRLVPERGLLREGDLVGVWTRTASGDDRRWIRVGKIHGDRLEVLSGLAAGDTIVVPDRLSAGR